MNFKNIEAIPKSDDEFRLREFCIKYGLNFREIKLKFNGAFDFKLHELVKWI